MGCIDRQTAMGQTVIVGLLFLLLFLLLRFLLRLCPLLLL